MASRLFRRKEKLKTSQGFGKRIKALFSGGRLDPESYQALEATLLGADVGHSATQEILDQLRTSKHHDHLETLQQVLSSLLANTASREIELRQIDSRPRVIMVVGVNGAGKTTFARDFLPAEAQTLTFINADLIAAGLAPFNPETASFKAGRLK